MDLKTAYRHLYELMCGVKRPSVFDKVMPKVQGIEHEEENITAKLEAAYKKMKQKQGKDDVRKEMPFGRPS